jgi:hypothetical protein
MTITKTCFPAARRKYFHIGHSAGSIFQPSSVAVAAIDARRIDRLIRCRAKLRDLVALDGGRSNLSE